MTLLRAASIDERVMRIVNDLTILTEDQVKKISESQSATRYTASEKIKLNGIEEGAEVNRDAQSTFDLIESLLPEGVTLRTAAQTYTLIRNLIQYGDIAGTPSIPDITGFITQTIIEGLISDAIVSAIDALPDEEGLNANQVNALITSAVADFLTESQIITVADARALLRYTASEKTKLADIQAGAQVNRNAQGDF